MGRIKALVFSLFLFAQPCFAVDVSSMSQLANALDNGETDIRIQAGSYTATENWGLAINTPNTHIQGIGNVEITGGGMVNGKHVIFQVNADNVIIENLKLGEVANHAIMVHGEKPMDADNFTVKSCYFKNCGDQMLKITYNPDDTTGNFCEDGLVQLCEFEFTNPTAMDYYTGGIDCHAGKNWIVRENIFRNIVSPTTTVAEPAIHFWSGSANTVVEQNLIVNCDRGIGFGLQGRGHVGGIIRNNMISLSLPAKDVGIELENCSGSEVYHNTVYSTNGYPFAISVRFQSQNPNIVKNNLANKAIGIRDNGFAVFDGNDENATISDFISATDLHLKNPKLASVQNNLVPNDFDGELRFENADVGADEINTSEPPPARPIAENNALMALAIGAIHFPNHLESYINWIRAEIPGLLPTPPDTTQTPPDTSGTPPDTLITPPDSSQVGLVSPDDIEYLGAFKLSGNNYAYGGGRALGFYPPNGTLYINGSDLTGRFAEIQIPSTLSMSRDPAQLPNATVLRSSSDATGGLWNPGGQIPRIGGGKPFQLNNGDWKIFFGTYDNYDVNWKDLNAAGYFSPDFSNPQGRWHPGPKVGSNAQSIWYGGKTARYGTVIPEYFRVVVDGMSFASGRSRGEYNLAETCGPSLYAIDLNQPNSDGTLRSICLLCYPTTGAQGENTVPPLALPGYSLTNEVTDVVWVDESVMFFDNFCRYPSHYFDADPNMNNDPGVCNENKGYTCGSQGQPAPGYIGQVLFYDSADLAKVARGELNPWDPRPYATANLSNYLIDAGCRASFGGGCYDSQNRKLYIVELGKASPDNPVIHVFHIKTRS